MVEITPTPETYELLGIPLPFAPEKPWLWLIILLIFFVVGVSSRQALDKRKNKGEKLRRNKLLTTLAITLSAAAGILSVYVMIAGGVVSHTNSDIESQNVADLKEVYSIEHIDTLDEDEESHVLEDVDAPLRKAVNKIPDREATAVVLTAGDGRHYDEARLVYHNISSDAASNDATHAISIEVFDESAQQWEELEN